MLKKLLLLALLAPLAACASASAKSPAERPTLDVPPPPPRVIEPAVPVETQPEPVPDLPAATPTAPPKPRPQPRESREPAKTEPKPEAPVEPVPAPPVAQPQTPAESPLRTPGTADGAEAGRQVREILDRARASLGAVNFQTLSEERRKAYNESKDFMKGAEDALKKQNYVFARSLAEKAEKLARELQGR